MFDWLFRDTQHDNECMKKIEIYYKTCTNELRIHNSYSIKHLCFDEMTDYYLKGCTQKEIDPITARIKYIPNKAQYDPYYDIKRFIGEY